MNNNQTNKGREDQPRDIDPDEIGKNNPAREFVAQKKVPVKESGFGREQGQTPADEHIEPILSQNDTEQNTYNNINDDDDRDHEDSTKDWDAENNRTGRNK
jgi:hypothetical protein